MGYTLAVLSAARGRWDWLQDLIDEHPSPEVLQDALSGLGWSPQEILGALAGLLGLGPDELLNPSDELLRRVERNRLGVLLPRMFEHGALEVREAALGWLVQPSTLYVIAPRAVLGWLVQEPKLARWLAPRFATEGMAWVGPDGVRRVAQLGADIMVRQAALAWCQRLDEGDAA